MDYSTASDRPDRDLLKKRLLIALALTLGFMAAEVAGGILSGSLALLADAAHMAVDAGALLLAYGAMALAQRHPSVKYTFGFHRAEILAAFVNAQVLLLVSAYIFYEAYRRFHQPAEIATGVMLWVAIAGLVANFVSLRLLHDSQGKSLNTKAAYLEVMTDMLGSLGVIGGALAISWTGWYWIDPAVSAGIGLLIVPRTTSLLRESAHILLEGTPGAVDLEGLRRELLALPEIQDVHDLHIWSLTSGVESVSLHVRAKPNDGGEALLRGIQRLLKARLGTEHVTVQVESDDAGCAEGHR